MVMHNKEQAGKQEKTVMRISIYNMINNTLLSAVKLAAGILGHSQAIISDAIHSAADVFETLIVYIGVKMSAKEADKGHPYGHERYECVAAIILSGILAVTGAGIGLEGITAIIDKSYQHTQSPGILAAVVAVGAIAVKEAMYWYTRAGAKRTQSTALMADAWHHRMDALCSAGSLLGVIGARMGYPLCDPLASVIICIFIIKAAVSIFMETVNKMTDHAGSEEEIKVIRAVVNSQSGVLGIHSLKTRMFGRTSYAEVEIEIDGGLSFQESYQITQAVKHKVEQSLPEIKSCTVYARPADKGEIE